MLFDFPPWYNPALAFNPLSDSLTYGPLSDRPRVSTLCSLTTASLTSFASQMCTCKLSISVCKTAHSHNLTHTRTARELPKHTSNSGTSERRKLLRPGLRPTSGRPETRAHDEGHLQLRERLFFFKWHKTGMGPFRTNTYSFEDY